jgi:hypothetical protein
MVRDIYTRAPSDPNYVFGVYDHSDPIESIITQIKMILGTTKGQVFGNVNFGIGLENLVFETRINKLDLEEKIKAQIYQYIEEAGKYSITAKVSFGRDSGTEFAVVDIYIDAVKSVGILIK